MIEVVKKLKPCTWKYNDEIPELNDGKIHFGFIAQDLEEIWNKETYAIVTEDQSGYKKVNYHELIAVLTKSIQDLTERVENLEREKWQKNIS